MTLELIIEDGTGVDNANTYISDADASTYFAARLHATVWTGETDGEKQKAALIQAYRILKTYPKWKVDFLAAGEIPQVIIDAQCELALVLLTGDRQAVAGTSGFKSIAVDGAVTLVMDPKTQEGVIPRHIRQMLHGYITATASVSLGRG